MRVHVVLSFLATACSVHRGAAVRTTSAELLPAAPPRDDEAVQLQSETFGAATKRCEADGPGAGVLSARIIPVRALPVAEDKEEA